MGRSIIAVLAGVTVAFMLIMLVEFIGHAVYPLPEGMNPNDPESVKAAMAMAPVGALLFVILAYAVGSLGGGWLAARLARQSNLLHALIVGALLMVAGIANMLMIPHPLWFWILCLVVFLPAAYLGAQLAKPKQATP